MTTFERHRARIADNTNAAKTMKEHMVAEETLSEKTVRLRAARLARDAEQSATLPLPKRASKFTATV